MTLEDRLRGALRAEAGDTEMVADEWKAVVDGAAVVAHRRRRSQRMIATGITAGVIAIVVAVIAARAPEHREGLVGPPPPPAPDRVLTVSSDGDLQIRRTSDGSVRRTVRTGLNPSLAPITVSKDGTQAFFDQPDPSCDGARKIERIDLESGKTTTIARGKNPVVSHDGEHLAFATSSEKDACDVFDTLVIRSAVDGSDRRYPASSKGAGVGITYIHWSVDDQRIAYTLLEPRSFTNRVMPSGAKPGTRLDSEPALSLPDQPVSFVAHGRVLLEHSDDAGVEFYTANIDGSKQLTLVTRSAFIDISTVATDATGTHLLWLERNADQRNGTSPAKLVRFSIGVKQPTSVANDILTAAWL